MASLDDFHALDVRAGTVVAARAHPGARRPAYTLEIDFGPLGRKTSSAQITDLYEAGELVGLQVVAVVNFPPRNVAGFTSEVLVLAVGDGKGENVLLIPERPVPDGGKIA